MSALVDWAMGYWWLLPITALILGAVFRKEIVAYVVGEIE